MVKTVTDKWLVEETTHLTQLTIEEGAELAAPEGKGLTLTVDGVGWEIAPGHYTGDVVVTVSDYFDMPPAGLFAGMDIHTMMRTAICVEDGKLSEEKCVPAIVTGGSYSAAEANGIKIIGTQEEFNGILVDGDSTFTLNDSKIMLDGDGGNDFIGFGAAVLGMGHADITINRSEIVLHGVTRCTVHAGGYSIIKINDSTLINDSPTTTKMRPAWVLGLDGTNRNAQITDNAHVYYNNCYLKGNGWGVQSVDGADACTMHFKDSKIELSGAHARGYGIFAIGDCKAYFDHCDFDVFGYSILMNTENDGYVEVVNGSKIKGDLYAAMIFRDAKGTVKIADSEIETGRACLLIKGSCTTVNISNTKMSAKNGIILQLIDNDDPGVMGTGFIPPHGEVDVPDPDRDLTAADPERDVFLTLTDMEVTGDFLNSSTNLRANTRKVEGSGPNVHTGVLEGISTDDLHSGAEESEEMKARKALEAYIDTLQGAHNVDIALDNAKITGVVSSATQTYREDVTFIEARNCFELSNVTQTPAPTVNNGVILSLANGSVWTVTGTSYITSLTIDETSSVVGKATVDGKAVELTAGTYTGKIVVSEA